MSKRHNITVIAGLSGVGKTYAINELKKYSDTFVHFSAGSIINKQRMAMGRDQLRLLSHDDILQNQYILIEQLNRELESVPECSLVLFDAHMVIDADGEDFEIPFDIFEKLNPTNFTFLYDEPEKILYRRTRDVSRMRPRISVKQLEEQQEQSLRIAQNYAHRLSVPFLSFTPNDLGIIRDKLLSLTY